jgi:hypothetical protein
MTTTQPQGTESPSHVLFVAVAAAATDGDVLGLVRGLGFSPVKTRFLTHHETGAKYGFLTFSGVAEATELFGLLVRQELCGRRVVVDFAKRRGTGERR